jgi:hypothetical protein
LIRRLALASFLLLALPAVAAPPENAVLMREATMYISPDAASTRLGKVWRGREVSIIEQSRDYLKVFTVLDDNREATGWIVDKGVVRKSTPHGDRILYGEAVDSETEAQKRRGRRNAARDAARLYYRVAEYFPDSPLAAEALWRAADIRWQIERQEVWTRPSAKLDDNIMRTKIEEEWMKELKKRFPGTRWEALAEFAMLDNDVCGDWLGKSKCPEKETDVYEEYVKKYPQSPKAAEALYEAARRQAALVEIYKTEGNPGRSASAKSKAAALAQRILTQHPETDWARLAQRLAYMLEQNIPTYGSNVE